MTEHSGQFLTKRQRILLKIHLSKRGETADFQEIQSTVFKCFVQELEKPNLKLQFDFFWKAQFLKEGKIFESQASNIKTSL